MKRRLTLGAVAPQHEQAVLGDAASLIDRFEHVGAEHLITIGLVEARNERGLVQFASSLYVHPTSEWAAFVRILMVTTFIR